MNGFEFLFALLTVGGMTSLHFLWLSFAYRLEKEAKRKEKETIEKRLI